MEQDIYDTMVNYILENQNKFYRLAFSYVKNKEAALDVVQNAICKALEKCYDIKNPNALKTWFYRILVNESLKSINSTKSESLADQLPEQPYTESQYDKDHDVYNAVQKLKEPMKTVIVLHFYEDMTLKQISEITGINLNTVKSSLYSALNKIEKELKEAVI